VTAGGPSVGSRIGDRYILEHVLGTGGMAIVYQARDERFERRVAVKFVRPTSFGPDALVERFRQEARSQGELHHENIAPVLDAGEEQGTAYIVLRLVEGGTLYEWLQANPTASVEHRLDLLRQVAAGLDYAHSAGLLHRDIKPSNVLIEARADESLRAVISDFGLARRIEETTAERLTAPGERLGTAFYTAPELWHHGDATTASDIYAFGCLAYEALTGRPPFMGETQQVIHGHLTRSPEPPSSYQPACQGAIDEAIAVLLNKDPALRPPTASAALIRIVPNGPASIRVEARAAPGSAEGSAQLLRPTLVHSLVYAGAFAGTFAIGRGTGMPGVWGVLTLAAVGMALVLYVRERKARSRLPEVTVGLAAGPAIQGPNAPPTTETIVPRPLPPGKGQLPPGPEHPSWE
jgi:serine/threonine protein kinase